MKKVLAVLSLVLFVLISFNGYAQATKAKEVKIKTFFDCAMGKATIEKELSKQPGVSKVIADLETKIVTVSFDSDKMSKERINAIIEKAGYKTEFTKEGTVIKSACEKKDTKCDHKDAKK
ncbi:MAG: cation transporter [Bacteroidota bacterium]